MWSPEVHAVARRRTRGGAAAGAGLPQGRNARAPVRARGRRALSCFNLSHVLGNMRLFCHRCMFGALAMGMRAHVRPATSRGESRRDVERCSELSAIARCPAAFEDPGRSAHVAARVSRRPADRPRRRGRGLVAMGHGADLSLNWCFLSKKSAPNSKKSSSSSSVDAKRAARTSGFRRRRSRRRWP